MLAVSRPVILAEVTGFAHPAVGLCGAEDHRFLGERELNSTRAIPSFSIVSSALSTATRTVIVPALICGARKLSYCTSPRVTWTTNKNPLPRACPQRAGLHGDILAAIHANSNPTGAHAP